MPAFAAQLLILKAIWLAFVVAFGCCIGSLVNVLVYRLPRGLGVVTPPSRCPSCNTRLTWRENIPVIGWLRLRGRCRFCRAPISPEYPLVEAFVGLLFGVFYVLWYMVPAHAMWLGIDWGQVRPEWAAGPVEQTVPTFALILLLLGALVAMTLVDAKTFTIPLELTIAPTVLAVVVHTGHAWWVGRTAAGFTRHAPGEVWSIPTPTGWPGILACVGAVLGLLVGNLLIATRLIGRSFADYEEWEKDRAKPPVAPPRADDPNPPATPTASSPPEPLGPGTVADPAVAAAPPPAGAPGPAPSPAHPWPWGAIGAYAAATLAAMIAGGAVAWLSGVPPGFGAGVGLLVGPVVGGLVARGGSSRRGRGAPVASSGDTADRPSESPDPGGVPSPAETWIAYPHARREMIRELAFLAPCIGLGLAGWYAGQWVGAAGTAIPLVARVLGGVLLGFLVGGGVVWAVRILGSIAFGKEAMGLGDVHLMAAVGACLGWIDATLAFFLAAFVGLYFAILGRVASGSIARAMPYGPYLAIATLLVLLFKPGIEGGLGVLLGRPINIP